MSFVARYQKHVAALGLVVAFSGCATYKGVVRPSPPLSVVSPEAEKLTDWDIEQRLKATARPSFPTVVAVAKVKPQDRNYQAYFVALEQVRGAEAEGWRRLEVEESAKSSSPLQQIQIVNALTLSGDPDLKNLRTAAATLHAPLLLVYMQDDNFARGNNVASAAYWTIVGLFFCSRRHGWVPQCV